MHGEVAADRKLPPASRAERLVAGFRYAAAPAPLQLEQLPSAGQPRSPAKPASPWAQRGASAGPPPRLKSAPSGEAGSPYFGAGGSPPNSPARSAALRPPGTPPSTKARRLPLNEQALWIATSLQRISRPDAPLVPLVPSPAAPSADAPSAGRLWSAPASLPSPGASLGRPSTAAAAVSAYSPSFFPPSPRSPAAPVAGWPPASPGGGFQRLGSAPGGPRIGMALGGVRPGPPSREARAGPSPPRERAAAASPPATPRSQLASSIQQTTRRARQAMHARHGAGAWVNIRVYLCSTAGDFAGERAHVQRAVALRLNRWGESRRVSFTFVDPRWGAEDGTEGSGEADAAGRSTLWYRLAEIDRCRPFFVALLGERYGLVPERLGEGRERLDFPWLAAAGGAPSLQELEVRYGAVEAGQTARALAFVRNPRPFLDAIPDRYRDKFVEGSPEAQARAAAVRDLVWRSPHCKRFMYNCRYEARGKGAAAALPPWGGAAGLDVFGDMLFTALTEAVEDEFASITPAGDAVAVETLYQRVWVSQHGGPDHFVGRARLLADLLSFASGGPVSYPHPVVAIVGAPGSGKTALLARVASHILAARPDVRFFANFPGASRHPITVEYVIERFCREMLGERYPSALRNAQAIAALAAAEREREAAAERERSAAERQAAGAAGEAGPEGAAVYTFLAQQAAALLAEPSEAELPPLGAGREKGGGATARGGVRFGSELEEALGDLDRCLAFVGSHGARCVSLVLDGVNQLSPENRSYGLRWLPASPPSNARILLSLTSGPLVAELRRRPAVRIVELPEMDDDERLEFILRVAGGGATTPAGLGAAPTPLPRSASFGRAVDPLLDPRAFADKEHGRRPLYVRLVAEEMLHGGLSLVARTAEIPGRFEPLLAAALASIERTVGGRLVRDCLCLIACSRVGLYEEELLTLLPLPAPPEPPRRASVVPEAGPLTAGEPERPNHGASHPLHVYRQQKQMLQSAGLEEEGPARLAPPTAPASEYVQAAGTGPRLARQSWTRLYYAIRQLLRRHDAGSSILEFAHRQVLRAVRERYLARCSERCAAFTDGEFCEHLVTMRERHPADATWAASDGAYHSALHSFFLAQLRGGRGQRDHCDLEIAYHAAHGAAAVVRPAVVRATKVPAKLWGPFTDGVAACGSLTALDLTACAFGRGDVAALARALKRTKSIATLTLDSARGLEHASVDLVEGLRFNSSLTAVSLLSCSLSADSMEHIVAALRGHDAWRMLDVRGNELSPPLQRSLAHVCSQNPRIEWLNGVEVPHGASPALDLSGRGLTWELLVVAARMKGDRLLTSLDLRGNPVSPDAAAAVANAYTANPTLRRLNGFDLPGDVAPVHALAARAIGWEALVVARALALPTCRVRTLSLAHNAIGPDGARALAERVRSGPSLEFLDISHNRLGDAGVAALAEGLERGRLRGLSLAANGCGDAGAAALGRSLARNQSLEELSLASNAVGPDGAAGLAAGLRQHFALRVLDLRENDLGDGGGAIADAYAANPRLEVVNGIRLRIAEETVDLTALRPREWEVAVLLVALRAAVSNRVRTVALPGLPVSDQSARHLAELVRMHPSLTALDMRFVNISSQAAHQLATAYGLNATLRTVSGLELPGDAPDLDLAERSITWEVAMVAQAMRQASCRTRRIDLSRNPLGPQACAWLGPALQSAPLLESVNLSRCELGDAGVSQLAEGILNAGVLKSLDLSGNGIGPAGMRAIERSLVLAKALEQLRLASNLLGSDGAESVGVVLRGSRTLRLLDVRDNGIGTVGGRHIANGYEARHQLHELNGAPVHVAGGRLVDLTGTGEGWEAALLLKHIKRAPGAVRGLALRGSRAPPLSARGVRGAYPPLPAGVPAGDLVGTPELVDVAEIVQGSTELVELDLRGCPVEREAADALVAAHRANPRLKRLNGVDLAALDLPSWDLSARGLSWEIPIIAAALASSKSRVRALDLSDNEVGAGGAAALAEALRRNGSLEQVFLRACGVDTEGARVLCEALRVNKAVFLVDLSYNPLDQTAGAYLHRTLAENPNLKHVHLEGISLLSPKDHEFLQKLMEQNQKRGQPGSGSLKGLQSLTPGAM